MECNYKISLHTFELFCDADVKCNTTNSNPQGKQKTVEVKCGFFLLIINLRNQVFSFPAQSTVIFIHLDHFIRAFLQVFVYLSYMYFIFMNVITFSYVLTI